jgi:hypothetical protein
MSHHFRKSINLKAPLIEIPSEFFYPRSLAISVLLPNMLAAPYTSRTTSYVCSAVVGEEYQTSKRDLFRVGSKEALNTLLR